MLPIAFILSMPMLFGVQAEQGHSTIVQLSQQQCIWNVYVFNHTYQCDGQNRLVIGIDFHQKPNRYPVTVMVTEPQEAEVLIGFITVTKTEYPITTWRVRQPKSSSKKTEKDEDSRRTKEQTIIVASLTSGHEQYPTMKLPEQFRSPLKLALQVRGRFGTKRVYKTQRGNILFTSHHRGVDLRASWNTRIYAVGDGVVVLVRRFSLEGKMIVLYHGNHTYSLYLHLREFKVKEGDYVRSGQRIGLSGNTGRSQAPHLHFAMKINNAVIDPIAFIEQFKP